METALDVRNIKKAFHGNLVVDDASFIVESKEVFGLTGTNGSGKSTIFNIVTGHLKQDSGTVRLFGKNLARLQPHEIASIGVYRTFQNIRLFNNISVLENLLTAFTDPLENNVSGSILLTTLKSNSSKLIVDKAMDILEKFGLSDFTNKAAGTLSYGQKKLLSVSFFCARKPRLMLLDEPFSGISPGLIEKISSIIADFSSNGHAVVLIEHNLPAVRAVCDRVLFMDSGKIILSGLPKEVLSSREVLKAYTGG